MKQTEGGELTKPHEQTKHSHVGMVITSARFSTLRSRSQSSRDSSPLVRLVLCSRSLAGCVDWRRRNKNINMANTSEINHAAS